VLVVVKDALNVPKGRFQSEDGFTMGRSQEITREELKFNKFIGRLRLRFSSLFHDLMRIQLIAKGIIRADEWKEIQSKIRYDFIRDNHFTELKDAELLNNRVQSLMLVDPYLGKYFSKAWVQKNVLRMDEEEITQMDTEISSEGEDAVPTELSMMQAQMQMQTDMQPEPTPEDQQFQQDSQDQELQHKDEIHQQRLNNMKSKE
jgi:hypothetical protein